MSVSLLADAVLVVHLMFVLFVGLGALLLLRWPRLAWLHLPAAIWGAYVEFSGRICPLTPLEVSLRRRAGEAGYEGGFIEHYVTAWIYPEGLSREIQIAIGLAVLIVNVLIYGWVFRGRKRSPDTAATRE
jgi:Protein of Unknown function (DUF2784)